VAFALPPPTKVAPRSRGESQSDRRPWPPMGRGVCLTAAALICALATIALAAPIAALGVFFFGVWGGVEFGRYLERWLEMHRGPGG